MRCEVDTIGSIQPGRAYGHEYRIIGEDGTVLVRGFSAGKSANAVASAKQVMGRIERSRSGHREFNGRITRGLRDWGQVNMGAA